jgi:glycosyltransferase
MPPRVSLILCVKDGMPYLPQALASVAAQSCRDFELVVQDGGSTDGSLEAVRSAGGLPEVSVVSGPDGGVGDAFNRAVRRCRGAVVGSIDADNLLAPDAVARAAAFFDAEPGCAAVYGASHMIDGDGVVLFTWAPPGFDVLGLLRCEVVPPFGQSFFNRAVCGDELRFEESMRTCADFDLWLRLCRLPIRRVADVLGSTRRSGKSMTCRPETYDLFCHDKTEALRRFLARPEAAALLPRAVERHLVAGVHAWAAESLAGLEGGLKGGFERHRAESEVLDPYTRRLGMLMLAEQLRLAREAEALAREQTKAAHDELRRLSEEARHDTDELRGKVAQLGDTALQEHGNLEVSRAELAATRAALAETQQELAATRGHLDNAHAALRRWEGGLYARLRRLARRCVPSALLSRFRRAS